MKHHLLLVFLLIPLLSSGTPDPIVGEILGVPILLSEIQPAPEVIETFAKTHSGNETSAFILSYRAEKLSQRILIPMAQRYLRHSLATASETELVLLQHRYQQLNPDKTLSREQTKDWWRTWKLNQLLFQEFGGRTVQREFGLEAVEAMGDYLKFQEATGGFIIGNKTMRDAVFHYFTKADYHQWYEGETVPWMQDAAGAMQLAAEKKAARSPRRRPPDKRDSGKDPALY